MYRILLILIVVFGGSSIGFAQNCPDGHCCKDCPPAGPRPYFSPDAFGAPNSLFERTEDRAAVPGLPGWKSAPSTESMEPRPGLDRRVQRLCPVTGEELGSMGPPIPVTVKGQTIQVCCKACVNAVQRNPEKYLQQVAADLSAQTRTVPANRPGSAVQRLCPVTGQALGSMGPPIPVTVSGRTVYVCCPACVDKLRRDPAKYLRQVDSERQIDRSLPPNGAGPAPFGPAQRDSARWGGQTTCPVTGDALGEEGEPIPVRVADRTIFVCCNFCVAAVRRNPESYLQRVDAELATRRSIGEPIH